MSEQGDDGEDRHVSIRIQARTRVNKRLAKFFSYYRPYLKTFAAVMAMAIMVTMIGLAMPLLIRYVTKDVLAGSLESALPLIGKIGGLMVVLVLLQAGGNYVVDYYGHSMGAKMERDMRRDLFTHLQNQPHRFFDEMRVGQLMSRLTNDLLNLVELYHHAPEDFVIYFVKFVGAFVILLSINVQLTLLVFVFAPILFFITLFFRKRMNLVYQKNKEQMGEINANAEDALSGIRVTKAYANEALELEKFNVANEGFLESRKSVYRNESYFSQSVTAVTELFTVAVVVLGGMSIVRGQIDLADLITYLLYATSITEPVRVFVKLVIQYQDGLTGFNRFMEIIELNQALETTGNARVLTDVQGGIEFHQVSFAYETGKRQILRHVSLTIHPGETIALVGPSGVGKTTLCSLIPRFYDITGGSILIDGCDIREIDVKSLRDHIGMVQQDTYIFAGTVYENILYGHPSATREQVIAAARQANAHDFIMEMPNDYDSDLGQKGVRLSGGQRQRLSIARVFLKNPPILILDEATSALDSVSEQIIQDSLTRLTEGRTTIIIAHRLSTVKNAQRIIVLGYDGIEESGSHDELLQRDGTYAHLYQLQFKYADVFQKFYLDDTGVNDPM